MTNLFVFFICFFFGISLYFNLRSIYYYFYPTKEFYLGDVWIFRNRIAIIEKEENSIISYYYVTISEDKNIQSKFVYYPKEKKFSIHRKVLEREAVLYTDELWNSILEKEKIKQEIENLEKELDKTLEKEKTKDNLIFLKNAAKILDNLPSLEEENKCSLKKIENVLKEKI